MTTAVYGPAALLNRGSPEWSLWAHQNPGPPSVDVGRDSSPVLIKIFLDVSFDSPYEMTRQSLFRFCFFMCVIVMRMSRVGVFTVGTFVMITVAIMIVTVWFQSV